MIVINQFLEISNGCTVSYTVRVVLRYTSLVDKYIPPPQKKWIFFVFFQAFIVYKYNITPSLGLG
jgi:hypothetical protein